jgi:Tol biopolymer transport system component
VYQSDQSRNDEIYLLNLDTKVERNLTAHMAADAAPSWSPDEREIVFVSDRSGKRQLWVMDAEGGAPRLLTSHVVPGSLGGWAEGRILPQWSSDGKSIAFIAVADRGDALWVANRDGSNARKVLDRVMYFDWYGDRHIIFVNREGENDQTQIRTIDLITGAVTPLLPDPAIELAVSLDSTKLLYTHSESHFNMNLWVQRLRPGPNGVPMLDGKSSPITNGRGDWHVHKGEWSPDGKTIVYTRDSDQGDIFTIEDYR